MSNPFDLLISMLVRDLVNDELTAAEALRTILKRYAEIMAARALEDVKDQVVDAMKENSRAREILEVEIDGLIREYKSIG